LDAQTFFEYLIGELIGHKVKFVRLAANSLLIYVDCEPGDEKGTTIWFDPPWHFSSPEGVLVGSRQAYDASEDKAALDKVSEPLQNIQGKVVDFIKLEPRSYDLFEGDFWVKSFTADSEETDTWHIRDNTTGKRVVGSPKGLFIREKVTRK
jgi:hypothetical protein